VQLLRAGGIEVYTGGDLEDRHRQVLSHHPSLLVDTGAALLMVGAAWVALRLGVAAEGRGLEDVAPPLSNHPP